MEPPLVMAAADEVDELEMDVKLRFDFYARASNQRKSTCDYDAA